MNFKEAYQKVAGYDWVYKFQNMDSKIAATITMGNNGLLVISFEADGTFSSNSQMDFFPPEYGTWQFDEIGQTIKVFAINDKSQPSLTFELPKLVGQVLRMYVKDDLNRWLEANIDVASNQHQQVIQTDLTTKQVILSYQSATEVPLYEFAQSKVIGIKRIKQPTNTITGLKESYQYILEHPRLEQIMITDTQEQLEVDYFEQVNQKLLLSPTMLVGSRSMMLEWLSAVIVKYNQLALRTKPTLSEVMTLTLNSYFKNRIQLID